MLLSLSVANSRAKFFRQEFDAHCFCKIVIYSYRAYHSVIRFRCAIETYAAAAPRCWFRARYYTPLTPLISGLCSSLFLQLSNIICPAFCGCGEVEQYYIRFINSEIGFWTYFSWLNTATVQLIRNMISRNWSTRRRIFLRELSGIGFRYTPDCIERIMPWEKECRVNTGG